MRSIIMIIPIIVLYASISLAAPPAPRNYHDWPEITDLPDDGRVQIYDPREPVKLNRHKNITGAKIKEEVRNAVNAPNDTPISKQAIDANPYKRTYESKDPTTGKINWYVQSNGSVVVVGTLTIGGSSPVPLSVSAVFPANGATGVDIASVPFVRLNKSALSGVGISTIYIVGHSTAPAYTQVCTSGCDTENPVYEWRWYIPATLAASTTYTIKVAKNSIVQTDGETTSDCGPMTDVAGVCQSTFTTGP